ncbi:TlpA family protein disulfide reductase [Actinokineospora enzanensis]|uniref:TlpA family protein disulfide reductase n=1 Tax=Actinokineospora enzanensis TaxID=155975 RepID=UPI000369D4B3|nr:TlpA disulfide reductase family protein [Actinokineospora enzanensis]
MNTALRWALVVVILAVAVTVAVWPRDSARSADPDAGQALTAPAEPEPDLTAARQAAGLAACANGSATVATLRGARAECMADGTAVDAGNFLGGRPVLVNVWATWCAPCRDELPLLAEYAASPGAVSVVGLAVQSPQRDALDLLGSLGVRYPNLFDRDDQVRKGLRVPDALPASYLIRADGTVTMVAQPRVFRSVADIRTTVDRYLGGGR